MRLPWCLFFLLFASHASAAVVYVSPLPGAERLNPETGIIARFDHELAPSDVTIRALASVTGEHLGRVVLSDDRRTVVFRPERPFAFGERVEAVVKDARTGEGRDYGFTIAAGTAKRFDRALVLDVPPVARVTALSDSMPDVPPDITATWSGTTAPGRLFLAAFPSGSGAAASYLMIVDNQARPSFERRMSSSAFDFKVQPDGRMTYFDTWHGCFFVMDSTYAVVDSFACGNGYITDVHELRLLPNGHALLLGLDPQPLDMSQVVPGGNPAAYVVGMILQELDAARNVVFEWRSWDHFEITDATHEDLTGDYVDYVHANAIEVDGDGNLLLSSRHMDEITKIDRTTGATIWRWGGKHDEFTLLDDALGGFSHQHAIRRIGDGRYTMFDNGNFSPLHASRAVEYELDETARTARLVWQYVHSIDTFGFAMGYVQRLPNGNTLVSYGTGDPDVVEVGPDGTERLEMKLPDGYYSYRVTRAPWGPEPVVPTLTLSAGFPNPFARSTRLDFTLARDTDVALDVYDVAGRRVRSLLRAFPAGDHSVDVDLSSQRAGIYFCRIRAGEQTQTRRLVFVP